MFFFIFFYFDQYIKNQHISVIKGKNHWLFFDKNDNSVFWYYLTITVTKKNVDVTNKFSYFYILCFIILPYLFWKSGFIFN